MILYTDKIGKALQVTNYMPYNFNNLRAAQIHNCHKQVHNRPETRIIAGVEANMCLESVKVGL